MIHLLEAINETVKAAFKKRFDVKKKKKKRLFLSEKSTLSGSVTLQVKSTMIDLDTEMLQV